MLDTIIKLLRDEKDVILDTPISIITITIVIWALLHFKFRHRIKDLNELILIKDQRIEEFKRATESGSPDAAADQLEELRKRLSGIEGDVVTSEQLAVLGEEIAKSDGRASLCSEVTDAESGAIAGRLSQVFRAADWKVSSGISMGTYEGRENWLSIQCWEGVPKNRSENNLMAALNKAGITYAIDTKVHPNPGEIKLDCVSLFIAAPNSGA